MCMGGGHSPVKLVKRKLIGNRVQLTDNSKSDVKGKILEGRVCIKGVGLTHKRHQLNKSVCAESVAVQ